MKSLYLLLSIYIALILSGCASNANTTPTQPSPQIGCKKHAAAVSYLKEITPNRPYKILGIAKVSKYNHVGIKRQEATIRYLMRRQAASLGGDAIINIKQNPRLVIATVIAYKQVLV